MLAMGSTMTNAERLWSTLGACLAVASCATTSLAPYPQPLGPTQQLVLSTDPAGAACSILRDGAMVAAVESTPGTVTVRRDFCPIAFHAWSTPDYCRGPLERIAPIEVSCRKQGYLELRRTFAVTRVLEVQSEEGPQSAPTAASQFAGGVAGIALSIPYINLITVPVALVATAAMWDQLQHYAYAYRALPEFFLTPDTFESEPASDTFFATLKAKLERAAAAQHAYINAQCRFWPCEANDPAPCNDLVCQRRRERVDAQLKALLDEIPALRAQVRIVPPVE